MNIENILYDIISIGEEMLKSGAESNRVEDSLTRMCESYPITTCDVYAVPTNITVTIGTEDGHYYTQNRRIHNMDNNYDRLDYLNNLSREICQSIPDEKTLHEKFMEVMNRKPQPEYLAYLSAIMGDVGFGIYYGCNLMDSLITTVVCALVLVWGGKQLRKFEKNLVVYNIVLCFISSSIVLFCGRYIDNIHPDRIILGLIMILITGLGISNGIRDLINKEIFSGILNVTNSLLGAISIGCGSGLAFILFNGDLYKMYIAPNLFVQVIASGVASMGFALFFKAAFKQSVFSGIGGCISCAAYSLTYQYTQILFTSVLVASVFVATFAYIMSRVHKAPATIFLTTAILPLVPGAALFYMMYGFVRADYLMAAHNIISLCQTCLAIAFGFIIVNVVTKYLDFLPQRKAVKN